MHSSRKEQHSRQSLLQPLRHLRGLRHHGSPPTGLHRPPGASPHMGIPWEGCASPGVEMGRGREKLVDTITVPGGGRVGFFAGSKVGIFQN